MNPFLKLNNQSLIEINIAEDGVLRLTFNEYSLIVYNRYEAVNCSDVIKLINRKVIKINIVEDKCFEINFEGALTLKVYIDDNSYNTPEAMELNGPNNLIAIWQ